MYKNDALVRPRYAETDQMGVIYHGNYYAWFEVGRSDFFRSLGYTYKRLEQEGIILPVVESSCKYIKPAMYDEEVLIRTFVEMQKGIRIGFKYEVLRKEDETLLAEGRTLHAFVGKDLKPIRLKTLSDQFKAVLEKVRP
ncbi:acyl-CoA thioesterase [Fusibacter sp. JL216-2]|uniref:acyl-CoA thioesterase n=1 Tax=Fusibacter sp. JL216-2 TaxID=3071453 RepID=UPI003D354A52